MERKKERLAKYFESITIYLEDIKDIQNYAEKVNCGVALETERYIFREWDEFYDCTIKFDSLKINFPDLFIDLDISKNKCYLHCYHENSENSITHFAEIERILNSCKRKQYFIFHPYIVISFFVIYLLLILDKYIFKTLIENTLYLSILYSLGLFQVFTAFFLRKKNKIYLKPKIEVNGFWPKKSDDILASIISNATIGVLGFLAGLFVQHYLKLLK